jgi:hypothetical protein
VERTGPLRFLQWTAVERGQQPEALAGMRALARPGATAREQLHRLPSVRKRLDCPFGTVTSFLALLFARSVFDGTMLGLGHRITILLFVQSKLALDSCFFIKHFPYRGGLIPTVFLIGERLQSPVEGKRKGDRNSRGFLVPHAADRVIANMTEQEDSFLTFCMRQSYTSFHAQNEAAKRQCAGDVPATARGPTAPPR